MQITEIIRKAIVLSAKNGDGFSTVRFILVSKDNKKIHSSYLHTIQEAESFISKSRLQGEVVPYPQLNNIEELLLSRQFIGNLCKGAGITNDSMTLDELEAKRTTVRHEISDGIYSKKLDEVLEKYIINF